MEKKGIKVVLADNNVQDRETRTKAIEEAGMQVVFSTGDGKKALDAIYREQPDIVVMDMILPGLDGIGILEEMEQVDRLKRLHIRILCNPFCLQHSRDGFLIRSSLCDFERNSSFTQRLSDKNIKSST